MPQLSTHPLAWVFATPAAFVTLILVLMHQSLIASSAYFLAQTITSYQDGHELKGPLALYLLSAILPIIPGCLSCATTQRWINAIHQKFALAMTSAVYGDLNEYRSAERRSAFESAISRNAFDVISSYAKLFHEFLNLALNSLLSIAVIAVILPSEIVLGYIISLITSIGLLCALSRTTKKRAAHAEKQYSEYGATLHKAWGNAVLGNAYNYRLWLDEFNTNGASYYAASQRLAACRQFGNITIASASLVPTPYLVYHLLVIDQIEAAVVAAIIVNLTRIFHILNSLGALVSAIVAWASASTRLRDLSAFLRPPPTGELPSSPVGTITLNGESVQDYPTVLDALRHRRCGRMTIRGEDGAGKSTLLLSIKHAFPEQAHLLPAGDHQLCWRSKRGNLSTGPRVRAIIDEILQQGTDARYLLLDEWDADLDPENRYFLDQRLETASKARVVIEIPHQDWPPAATVCARPSGIKSL